MKDIAFNIIDNACNAVNFTDHTDHFITLLDRAIEASNGRFTVEYFDSRNRNKWCIRIVYSEDKSKFTMSKIHTERKTVEIVNLINDRRQLQYG